ncbi:MAG: YihA family ribosome biogenesis GTP-binding protein [Xanthomonadaceae bacterium]|nr:ribosome biogenesis GTP-binding protein YihA/YsxC [Xanthomonadaceae bacterium]MDE1884862.1 YihA family ribosome biogenesis GTP-binding protein [Xanthomonadaceae bacterium]MDE1961740.1 YihA family ribosome biogenesis GTP-binding protein [Xanthomonadaceae bacterium]MDE2085068.1 YihA family ribosome biogenesis GTP-binding protein [Xanthomonadaceae bacterium]MDE2257374.1 YihA family ribosome biogenesis GTP-binding protein [Xanthomonadaceae bacterium]
MSRNPFRTARFVTSAPDLRHLPPDTGAEIAFAGRSNAGKSSALNAICDQTGLARTSKTPGRTQLLNVFVLDDAALGKGWRLIDLPGYGYARVPEALREKWRGAIDAYLRERESLRGVVLIVDARHPLKDFDRQMLTFCHEIGLSCHVLLTKADKLSRSEGVRTLAAVRNECRKADWNTSMQLFSAQAKTGLDEARAALQALLADRLPQP